METLGNQRPCTVELKPTARAMRQARSEARKSGYKPRGFCIPEQLIEAIDRRKAERDLPNRDVVANGMMARALKLLKVSDIPLPVAAHTELQRRRIVLSLHEDYITFIEQVCRHLRNVERGVAFEAIAEALKKQPEQDSRQLSLDQFMEVRP